MIKFTKFEWDEKLNCLKKNVIIRKAMFNFDIQPDNAFKKDEIFSLPTRMYSLCKSSAILI